jgi:hypothetical protein
MAREFDIVENYVAVWNEPDPDERRRRIREVWAPDGSTCYRLLEACGYEAIEKRVCGSWDRWLRDGKYRFRPHRIRTHHDIVKLDFVMENLPESRVEADGLCFLVLAADGRIKDDYQFNANTNEPSEIVERYLAVWNENDPRIRQQQIAELWAPDARFVSETAVRGGWGALQAEALEAYGAHVVRGRYYVSANRTQHHHNLVKFQWWASDPNGAAPCAAATELLVLDGDSRISFGCRFAEPV